MGGTDGEYVGTELGSTVGYGLGASLGFADGGVERVGSGDGAPVGAYSVVG